MMMMRPALYSCALLLLSSGAYAQSETSQESGAKAQAAATKDKDGKKDDTADKAGDIATQPVRDVGLSSKKIPPILQKAANNPYAPAGKCTAVSSEIGQLNGALGPDLGAGGAKANENRAGKIAAAGGETIVNSLIPFRGLVREVSGAAPAERRLATAVTAGVARRGYLRGLATARGCRIPK